MVECSGAGGRVVAMALLHCLPTKHMRGQQHPMPRPIRRLTAPHPARFHCCAPQGKRTKKVGICGKYGTRYGASLRKISKRYEMQMREKYVCDFCGKPSVRRLAGGIWKCKAKTCGKTMAGGCWLFKTATAVTVKASINRLKKSMVNEDQK